MPFIQFKNMLRHIVEQQVSEETYDFAYTAGWKTGHDSNGGLVNNPYTENAELKEAWVKGLLRGIVDKTNERKSK